jgi:hypothetical protein
MTKSKSLIVAPTLPEEFQITLTNEGELIKKRLLESSGAITVIDTIEERDTAIAVASDIASHLKAVEQSRKAIKEPFYKTGKEIDRIAEEHCHKLAEEKVRLDRHVGQFENERLKAIHDEQVRLDREQREKEAATQAKVDAAKTKKQKLASELELENAEQARREADIERQRLEELKRQEAAKGGMRRMEVNIQVLDMHFTKRAPIAFGWSQTSDKSVTSMAPEFNFQACSSPNHLSTQPKANNQTTKNQYAKKSTNSRKSTQARLRATTTEGGIAAQVR